MEGPNLFIDFSIIQKSPLDKLTAEFDQIIRVGKSIFVWSKTTPVTEMYEYCKNLKISRTPEEIETHKKCCALRAEGKIYKEIADELKISVSSVSFYVTTNPERDWVLDDWIQDYMPKDSTYYQKVDILVDPDLKLVERFKNGNIEAHLIEKL